MIYGRFNSKQVYVYMYTFIWGLQAKLLTYVQGDPVRMIQAIPELLSNK